MTAQVQQIQRDLDYMLNATKFEMTKTIKEEYIALRDDDWWDLIQTCLNKGAGTSGSLIKQKDIIILRLFLTFMGRDQAKDPDDSKFLELCGLLIMDLAEVRSKEQQNQKASKCYNFSKKIDPEQLFVISEENKKRIKELLVNLQREKLLEDERSNTLNSSEQSLAGLGDAQSGSQKILETLTNLLFEALQFVQIIPSMMVQEMRGEMDELKKVAEAFNTIKNLSLIHI